MFQAYPINKFVSSLSIRCSFLSTVTFYLLRGSILNNIYIKCSFFITCFLPVYMSNKNVFAYINIYFYINPQKPEQEKSQGRNLSKNNCKKWFCSSLLLIQVAYLIGHIHLLISSTVKCTRVHTALSFRQKFMICLFSSIWWIQKRRNKLRFEGRPVK